MDKVVGEAKEISSRPANKIAAVDIIMDAAAEAMADAAAEAVAAEPNRAMMQTTR